MFLLHFLEECSQRPAERAGDGREAERDIGVDIKMSRGHGATRQSPAYEYSAWGMAVTCRHWPRGAHVLAHFWESWVSECL